MKGIQERKGILLAVAFGSGSLAQFAFSPYRTPFIAYFFIVPFILVCERLLTWRDYLLGWYLFGMGYFISCLYWIAQLERDSIAIPALRFPAMLVLSLYLSVFFLLSGMTARRMSLVGIPCAVSIPISWAGFEYLRSLGILGFPWASLGYSQTYYVHMVQIASLIGTYGLSGWLVFINCVIAEIFKKKLSYILIGIAATLIPLSFGYFTLKESGTEGSLSVALVQPNIPGSVKWKKDFKDSTMRLLFDMTLESKAVRLVVWPETSIPFYFRYDTFWFDEVRRLARAMDANLLVGYPDYRLNGNYRFYNSAMLIDSNGEIKADYRKIHLVPFGEMIPFENRIGVLRKIELGQGNFSPGDSFTVFNLEGIPFSVLICFESIFPDLVREFVRRGAKIFVNITNDEWFGTSPAAYQHAQMAIMRAVEFRVGIARCANTGISMIVDPYGRVTSSGGLFERQVIKGIVVAGKGRSFYQKYGKVMEIALLCICGIMSLPLRRHV